MMFVLALAGTAAAQGSVQGLTVSAGTVDAGDTVSATATGTSPCGAVHIDWGDGTAITYATETLPVTQTHVYKSGGTFNLRAQGMGNCTGEARSRIVVKGPPPPPPTLTRIVVSAAKAEPRAPVDIALEGSGACAVRLDFGDGNGETIRATLPQRVRHAYGAPGRYTIVATPQSPCVERRTATIEIATQESNEITGISVDQPAGASQSERSITVHGTGRCAYVLDFGDGNRDTRTSALPDVVRHNYPAAGRYRVVATARPPCRGTMDWTFVVGSQQEGRPDGRLSGVRVRPQAVGTTEPVTIVIDGSGTCRFVVDFHDGESRTLTERLPFRLQYSYPQPGDYTIVVWAHEPCSGDGEALVRVRRR
jgi:hypothetical protein